MSLRFHWFLPTNGDGRDIVGGAGTSLVGSHEDVANLIEEYEGVGASPSSSAGKTETTERVAAS